MDKEITDMFNRVIEQNNLIMESADKRLEMANKMVLKLAESADKLADSVSEMKDMMVHLEKVYTSRNDTLVKNRDEFKEAYTKLLHQYEGLQKRMFDRYDKMEDESWQTLTEIARRPTMNTTNNNASDNNPRAAL